MISPTLHELMRVFRSSGFQVSFDRQIALPIFVIESLQPV